MIGDKNIASLGGWQVSDSFGLEGEIQVFDNRISKIDAFAVSVFPDKIVDIIDTDDTVEPGVDKTRNPTARAGFLLLNTSFRYMGLNVSFPVSAV